MNVWNKVLMVLTTIACIAFAVFAANKYSLTKSEESKLAKMEQELADVQKAVQDLKYEIYGSPEKKIESWRDAGLDAQLDRIRGLQNGEAYLNCRPLQARTDEDSLSSTVSFSVSSIYRASSFRTGAVAFVFDSGAAYVDETTNGEDGVGAASDVAENSSSASAPYSFLGAFKVAGVSGTQVNLESIGNASVAELGVLERSAKSGSSWVVYVDRLPYDSPDDFASFYNEAPEKYAGLGASAAALAAKSCVAFADTLETNAESRYPIDFQGNLERQWTVRDEQNVMLARNTAALKDLTNVVADQLVALGGEIPGDVKDVVEGFENWAVALQNAQARKTVDSYTETSEKVEKSLAKMTEYRDLVASILKEAQEGVKDCEQAVDETIAENARLASEIARVQYIAAEKVQENETRTASFDLNAPYDMM